MTILAATLERWQAQLAAVLAAAWLCCLCVLTPALLWAAGPMDWVAAAGPTPVAAGKLALMLAAVGTDVVILLPVAVAGLGALVAAVARRRSSHGAFTRGARGLSSRVLATGLVLFGMSTAVGMALAPLEMPGWLHAAVQWCAAIVCALAVVPAVALVALDDVDVPTAVGQALTGLWRRPGDTALCLALPVVITLPAAGAPALLMMMGMRMHHVGAVAAGIALTLVAGALVVSCTGLYAIIRIERRIRPSLSTAGPEAPVYGAPVVSPQG